MKITSRDNQKLKTVRKIRSGKISGLIFIEGFRLAGEALRSELLIREAFFSENALRDDRSAGFLNILQSRKIPSFELTENLFNTISATKNSQGIVLIADRPETGRSVIEQKIQNSERAIPLLILLHEINNPANLGSILRTAEAAGVAGIILTRNSSDAFSPKALRGAMGAGFRIPVWENTGFFEILEWAAAHKLNPVCADINSNVSYLEIDWNKPRLLVFGSEAHGLSRAERQAVPEDLLIPLENNVESLNLAVACGIILFEAKRQTG